MTLIGGGGTLEPGQAADENRAKNQTFQELRPLRTWIQNYNGRRKPMEIMDKRVMRNIEEELKIVAVGFKPDKAPEPDGIGPEDRNSYSEGIMHA